MNAFLAIVVIHLLAVASPGPDFAIILKQSLTQSRRAVVWTAVGLGCGILLHVTYSLLGIGLVISQSILLFNVIKYAGAAYLVYIGIKGLLTKPSAASQVSKEKTHSMSSWKALQTGFLCNALNPKVTVFFVALFTQVIDQSTPFWLQAVYGIYMACATIVWFSSLGMVLSLGIIRRTVDRVHHWIERVMGGILILLGIKVALASRE